MNNRCLCCIKKLKYPENNKFDIESERAVPFPGLSFENFNWVKVQLNLVWFSIQIQIQIQMFAWLGFDRFVIYSNLVDSLN